MLICENDDGLIIGHQCGFHLPQKIGKSVFANFFNDIESINTIKEIIHLLNNIIKDSFSLHNVIVYHYLPADTLYKIIDQSDDISFSLRFTNVNYMNDKMDGKYGNNEFIVAFKHFFGDVKNKNNEMRMELRNEIYTQLPKLLIDKPCTRNSNTYTLFMVDGVLCNAYVCSLSLDPESIPLWKNYGSGFSESYAIGLNTKGLADVCICRIEYNNYDDERRSLPGVLLKKIFSIIEKEKSTKSEIHTLSKAIIEFMSAWSISHKDYYWEYEKEVRLVKFMPVDTEPHGYSIRNGVFRPYINVPFDKKCVKDVVVGPMVERYNAARSIDEYMGKKGFGGGRNKLHVRCSVLPVRF